MKYALEEIDEPTCRDAVEELEARKAELTREAAGLNEELSNLAAYVSTTVSMSSQLVTWWSHNNFDTCQSIQKLVHPRGIYWDNEKKRYLTIEENEVFGLFRSISSDYEATTNKKKGETFPAPEVGLSKRLGELDFSETALCVLWKGFCE